MSKDNISSEKLTSTYLPSDRDLPYTVAMYMASAPGTWTPPSDTIRPFVPTEDEMEKKVEKFLGSNTQLQRFVSLLTEMGIAFSVKRPDGTFTDVLAGNTNFRFCYGAFSCVID
jgi:hypothetical protein